MCFSIGSLLSDGGSLLETVTLDELGQGKIVLGFIVPDGFSIFSKARK